MEAPIRNASFEPMVNCSTCGQNVQLSSMGSHFCSISNSSSNPALGQMPLPSPAESLNGFPPRENSFLRPQRPLLPRIDPSVANRPNLYTGELTPASSGHNSLASPMSAVSGRKSPWGNPRKPAASLIRRPPSPELTNLDCAFPPFPMGNSRSKTPVRDERSKTKREESRPPLRRPGTAGSSAGSVRRGPADAFSSDSSSSNFSRPRSKSTAADDRYSKASTATTAISSAPGSRKPSVDNIPPVPQAPRSVTDPLHPLQRVESSNDSPPLLNQRFEHSTNFPPTPELITNNSFDMESGKHDALRPFSVARSDSSSIYEDLPPQQFEADYSVPEPSYPSKRPPPILSNLPPPAEANTTRSKPRSPTVSQPASAAGLGRSLTRLFTRKRSQTTTSRREEVPEGSNEEHAEPETPPMPTFIGFEQPQIAISGSQSPSSLDTPESLSFVTESRPGQHELGTEHEASLRALEGSHSATGQVSSILPQTNFSFDENQTQNASHHWNMEAVSELVESPVKSDLQRVSMDSVSSYGSMGFTEKSSSSRSSPPTDELMGKITKSSYSELLPMPTNEMPPPSQLKTPASSGDSPTDPLFQHGHLSPIPPVRPVHPERSASLNSSVSDFQVGEVKLPRPSEMGKNKKHGTNKGVCRGCSNIISTAQKSVTSADGRLTGRYHKECFVCYTCKSPFATAEFYVHANRPYCAHHYHELENSLCATCGKGIEGLYMETSNVAGRGKGKHHPGCLRCTTCKIQLDHDYFELSGKVYCERDAFRVASVPKLHDRTPARPSPLVREYISSGDPGLLSGRNFPERRTTRLMTTK